MKHPDYPSVSSFTDNRGETRYRFRRTGRKTAYLPGRPHTQQFDEAYQAALAGGLRLPSLHFRKALQMRALKERPVARNIERLLAAIRRRSSTLKREFQLDQDWLLDRLREQDFKCAITGIPFVTDYQARHPHCISIDRIDNRRGYTPDNVRVVTLHANLALNSFGLEQFDMLCLARASKKLNDARGQL